MNEFIQFQKIFKSLEVLRPPKHRLSTFGSTKIDYTLITDVPDYSDRSKIRTGSVTAERPLIITAQNLKEKFLGFGDEAKPLMDLISSQYGESLQGLEYQFRNESYGTRIELQSPKKLAKEMTKSFDQESTYRHALLRGVDQYWQLSVMKFIIEETMASFSSNLQELKDRGFFEGETRIENRQHREIKNLFSIARKDKAAIPTLANKLKSYGLFEEYQDQFFGLVK